MIMKTVEFTVRILAEVPDDTVIDADKSFVSLPKIEFLGLDTIPIENATMLEYETVLAEEITEN